MKEPNNQALRAANIEAQRQAIEACAKIADTHAEPTDTPCEFTTAYELAASKIARSIRKLSPNEALALPTDRHAEGRLAGLEEAAKVAGAVAAKAEKAALEQEPTDGRVGALIAAEHIAETIRAIAKAGQ